MYQVQDSPAVLRATAALLRGRVGAGVGRTVLLLGIVSLLTDISSEMVATILPIYLLYTVGLSPLLYGITDGVYQAGAALVRIASGFVSDRWRRYKAVAAVGYGVSAFCKPLMIAVGSAWPPLLATILLDRAGKGIRTAPRDAMISLSTPAERLGTAFGVHRALDTTGAMIGPLLAFALLLWTPTAFDSIFFVSFCFALVGLSVLLLFVKNPAPHSVDTPPESLTPVRSLSLLAERRFLTLVIAGTILGAATMSDGFVYLGLQQELDFEPGMFPLLFVATAAVYMLLAVPLGRLADRIGRAKVFLGGNALLLLVYAALLTADLGLAGVVACTSLLGAYYAATDGVLTAMASALLNEEVRSTGLAVLGTATTMSRLVSAVLFGALWTAFGYQSAVVFFAGFLVFSLLSAAFVLLRARAQFAHA